MQNTIKMVRYISPLLLLALNPAFAYTPKSMRPEAVCTDARGSVADGELRILVSSEIAMAGSPSPRKYLEITESKSGAHARMIRSAFVSRLDRKPSRPNVAPVVYAAKGLRLEIFEGIYPVNDRGDSRSILKSNSRGVKIQQEMHCRFVGPR